MTYRIVISLILVLNFPGTNCVTLALADSAPPVSNNKPVPETEQENAKQQGRIVSLATLLLSLLLLLSVTLLGFVIISGNRVRRMARKSLPKTQKVDPLWYLKTEQKQEPLSDPKTMGDIVLDDEEE